MIYEHHDWSGALQDAFTACTEKYKKTGPSQWQLHLEDQMTSFVTMRLADDWLLFEASRVDNDEVSRDSLWQLLQWNAELPGGAKFALTGSKPVLQVRAEIPLIKRMDLTVRVHQTCAGFRRAWTRIDDLFEDGVRNGPAACMQPAGDLTHLCQEAGWPFSESTAGRLNIELETQNAFHQAVIEQRSSQVHVEVEIAAGESISLLCREALAMLLLATAGQLRMARPVVAETDGRFSARIEVVFDALPSVQELHHALSALSMGCRITASEATSLGRDEVLAQKYLSLRRMDWDAAGPRLIGKSNNLTKAPTGAEKGAEPWVQQ